MIFNGLKFNHYSVPELSHCLSIAIGLMVVAPTSVIAMPVLNFEDGPTSQLISNKIRFPTADDRGAPVTTTGGGTRGETCLVKEQSILFPFAPSTNMLTTAANPTIFVYLPQHRANTGSLRLLNAQGNEVYYTEVALPPEKAILAITLPDSVALEAEQSYGWQFKIYCPSKVVEGITVEDDFTDASLKQVTLGTSSSESTLTALEKAQIYVDQGIWNDVLTTMAPLREQEPETWQALLDYLNLGEFADTELVLIEPQ